MNERRLRRLESQIKTRVAETLARDLADPRRGLITITRVELDRELTTCKVFWSVLGSEAERRKNEHMLRHARGFLQREVATILHTRTVPRVRFEFDESIAGAIRVHGILRELRGQRDENAGPAPAGDDDGADAPQRTE